MTTIPGIKAMNERYRQFLAGAPALCAELRWDRDSLEFVDYSYLVNEWITRNP